MRTDWSNFYDVADKMTTVGEEVSAAPDKVAQSGGGSASSQPADRLSQREENQGRHTLGKVSTGVIANQTHRIETALKARGLAPLTPQGAGGRAEDRRSPRGGGAKSGPARAQKDRQAQR